MARSENSPSKVRYKSKESKLLGYFTLKPQHKLFQTHPQTSFPTAPANQGCLPSLVSSATFLEVEPSPNAKPAAFLFVLKELRPLPTNHGSDIRTEEIV